MVQEEQPSCKYRGNNAQTLSCRDTESIDPPSAAANNTKENERGGRGRSGAACSRRERPGFARRQREDAPS